MFFAVDSQCCFSVFYRFWHVALLFSIIFNFFKDLLIYFVCVFVYLCACVRTFVWVSMEILRAGVTAVIGQLDNGKKLNLGLQEEHRAVLVVEPSLQPFSRTWNLVLEG